MVFWIPLIMGAAALSGAIMSANGKKYIDPNWIEEHTGSHAFAQEFNNMFNQLQSSPQGQEMINSAMANGQQIANTIKQNSTNAGFGGAEGVQSGGSLFASSVSDSAPNSMRRMAQAAIGQQAQGSVNDILQRRLNAYLTERGQPSKQEVIGNMLMQGGMMGLQASLMGSGKGGEATPKGVKAEGVTGEVGPASDATVPQGPVNVATPPAYTQPDQNQPTTPPTNIYQAPSTPTPEQDKGEIVYNSRANRAPSQQFAFGSFGGGRGAFRNFGGAKTRHVGRLGTFVAPVENLG